MSNGLPFYTLAINIHWSSFPERIIQMYSISPVQIQLLLTRCYCYCVRGTLPCKWARDSSAAPPGLPLPPLPHCSPNRPRLPPAKPHEIVEAGHTSWQKPIDKVSWKCHSLTVMLCNTEQSMNLEWIMKIQWWMVDSLKGFFTLCHVLKRIKLPFLCMFTMYT